MSKLTRAEIVSAALMLLEDVGLDGLTTRRLAQRLGIESPTLYWHFKDKAALLAEVAVAALADHHATSVPPDSNDWKGWFADNARSLRRALLAHRDGAKLHAGTTPGRQDLVRLAPKVAFLERAGFQRTVALMGLRAAGQYTLGCVLEDQAIRVSPPVYPSTARPGDLAVPTDIIDLIVEVSDNGGDGSFEFGLALLIGGFERHLCK